MPGSDHAPAFTGSMDRSVETFAADVGATGPVCVVGSGSRGGGPLGAERTVHAPAGIVRVDAAEMIVECGAGTMVADLQAALADVGQTVSIPPGGTVGGALAVGRSDITRLAHGPLRDVLLQTHYVSAAGRVVKAGGATVKNVSGFDLCRLLVGSHGTLGFFGDVILRTRPLPVASRWFRTTGDPFTLVEQLYRPVCVLWDGTTTWVRLDGDASDVDRSAERHQLDETGDPPELPVGSRWSLPPSRLRDLPGLADGAFVAEIGVGIVHHTGAPPQRTVDDTTLMLHRRLRDEFDPDGRLNPGVDPLAG